MKRASATRRVRRCLFCGALPSDTRLIARLSQLVCVECFDEIGTMFSDPKSRASLASALLAPAFSSLALARYLPGVLHRYQKVEVRRPRLISWSSSRRASTRPWSPEGNPPPCSSTIREAPPKVPVCSPEVPFASPPRSEVVRHQPCRRRCSRGKADIAASLLGDVQGAHTRWSSIEVVGRRTRSPDGLGDEVAPISKAPR
jgi:hypothetical protein